MRIKAAPCPADGPHEMVEPGAALAEPSAVGYQACNAMTTDRSCRRARSADEALVEVSSRAGTHFDPDVVAALEAVALGSL